MTELPPHIPSTASYRAPSVLLSYQQRWVTDASPFRAIEKSRHTDTTRAEAPDSVLTAASSAPAGGMNVYYIAYNQNMTVEYIQACAMWARAFNYAISEIEEGFWEEDDDDKHIRTYTIEFLDPGSRIVALSSHPSNLCGRQDIIVIGEAASREQLDELLRATLAVLIWGGKVCVISTHNGDDNPFNTLIGDIRAGRQGGSIHRTTFREAISEGLSRRVCLRTGKEWSEVFEQARMASVYKFYGIGASEELDCIPANGGGAWLSRALIESRISADTPILRLTCKEGYELLSDEVRFREIQNWLDECLGPLLEALLAGARSFLGCDFGRNGDLSMDCPLLQEKSLVRRAPLVLKLRNVSFRQQEQITWYPMDSLPGLLSAALNARGNGAYLAEYVIRRHGSGRIQQMTPTGGWYREYMSPVEATLEDGNLVDLPKDKDTLDDLRAVQVANGVPRVPEQHSKAKADGGKRHGDSIIASTLAYLTSREINKGPVKASLRRRRQAVRILEGP